MNKLRNCGFTLVEIMVVVAVITILTAIAVPGYMAYRKTSHAQTCRDNMHLIKSAMRANEIKTGKLETDLDKLIGENGGGFLKWKPTCPVGGTYNISVDKDTEEITITCTQANSDDHNVSE